jgi:hypothetical protein
MIDGRTDGRMVPAMRDVLPPPPVSGGHDTASTHRARRKRVPLRVPVRPGARRRRWEQQHDTATSPSRPSKGRQEKRAQENNKPRRRAGLQLQPPSLSVAPSLPEAPAPSSSSTQHKLLPAAN